jgi:hypothetical protein
LYLVSTSAMHVHIDLFDSSSFSFSIH